MAPSTAQAWLGAGVVALAMVLRLHLLAAVDLNIASIKIARATLEGSIVTPTVPAVRVADTGDALVFASLALESDPDNPAVWRQIGRAWQATGRLSEAEIAFGRAAQSHPTEVIARDALARLHLTMGHPEQAIADWRAIRAATPLAALGKSLSEDGRWAEAMDAYRASIEAVPAYSEAYYPLGWALYEHAGDTAGAFSIFLRARDVAPNSPWPYVNVGDLYVGLGQIETAIPWFVRAREVAPREPGLDAKLAWAYTAYGDKLRTARQWAAAEAAYRSALEAVPTYQAALRSLAEIAAEKRNNG